MDTEGGIGAGPSWETPVWAVRIRRGDGTVVGAGVLVGPEWVLTCACVVTEGERITVEFVGVPGRRGPGWPTTRADRRGPGGVALLRLAGPGPAGAAGPLYRRSVPRRAVRIYGFPAADGEGAWLRGRHRGRRAGDGRDGRVRLAVPGTAAAAELVPPGYAGAGVSRRRDRRTARAWRMPRRTRHRPTPTRGRT